VAGSAHRPQGSPGSTKKPEEVKRNASNRGLCVRKQVSLKVAQTFKIRNVEPRYGGKCPIEIVGGAKQALHSFAQLSGNAILV